MKNTVEEIMYGNPYEGKTVNESKTVTYSNTLTADEQWKIDNADWIDTQTMYFGKSGKEIREALEVVQLLDEMIKTDCCLYGAGLTRTFCIEHMDTEKSIYKILSVKIDLLEALKDAKEMEWKP